MKESLGQKLKELRETFELTQGQVAYKLNISTGTISHWENGRRKPSYEEIAKLCEVYGVTADYLLGKTTVPDGEVITRIDIMSHTVKVYGHIPAGVPFEAIEDMLDEVSIPAWLAKKKDLFGLLVVGDSMSKVIPDGCIAVFQKTESLDNGDIGAILVNGYDATIKKFYRLTDSVVLEPVSYNEEHKPIIIHDGEDPVTPIGKLLWFCSNIDF